MAVECTGMYEQSVYLTQNLSHYALYIVLWCFDIV